MLRNKFKIFEKVINRLLKAWKVCILLFLLGTNIIGYIHIDDILKTRTLQISTREASLCFIILMFVMFVYYYGLLWMIQKFNIRNIILSLALVPLYSICIIGFFSSLFVFPEFETVFYIFLIAFSILNGAKLILNIFRFVRTCKN